MIRNLGFGTFKNVSQVVVRSFSSERHKGIIKAYNVSKGFGFIAMEDKEVFVHQSTIKKNGFRSLKVGEEVEFDLSVDEQNRYKAINVTGPDGSEVIGATKYFRKKQD